MHKLNFLSACPVLLLIKSTKRLQGFADVCCSRGQGVSRSKYDVLKTINLALKLLAQILTCLLPIPSCPLALLPQAKTFPSSVRNKEWCLPVDTAVTYREEVYKDELPAGSCQSWALAVIFISSYNKKCYILTFYEVNLIGGRLFMYFF